MNNDIKCVVCGEWLYNHTTDDTMNCLVKMAKPDFKYKKELDKILNVEAKTK